MANSLYSKSIALRIAGTKQRQAGFAPLASIGVLAGDEGANMDRVLMLSEKPAFLIKHEDDYIFYMLVDRLVKPFDADSTGVLCIALTIGRAVRLADGRSPYDLLMEVYETFRSRYMVPVSDGRDSFQNMDVDNEVFREILSHYPLEDCEMPYVRMNPAMLTGIICVPQPLLSDFFRDTQYKEFASFRDIEVGTDCVAMVSPGLDQIRIPRPVSYRVVVNGRSGGQKLTLMTDICHASVPPSTMEEYEPVEFSLGELMAAPSGVLEKEGAVIRLNKADETIVCQLQKKDIKYAVVTVVSGFDDQDRSEVKQAYLDGQIRIQLDGQDITDDLTRKTPMRPQDVIGHRLSIFGASSRYILSISAAADHAERKIKFTINVSRKTVAPPPPPPAAKKPSYPPAMPQSTEVRFHSKSFFIGLLSGLLVGLIAIALLFFLNGNKGKEESRVFNSSTSVVGGTGTMTNASTDTTRTDIRNTAESLDETAQQELKEQLNALISGLEVEDIDQLSDAIKAAKDQLSKFESKDKESLEDAINNAETKLSELKTAKQEEASAHEEKGAEVDEAKKADEDNLKRLAALDWWGKNSDKSWSDFQSTNEYKKLSRNDQCAFDKVFRYSQYGEKYGYKARTPQDVNDLVVKRLPQIADWNDFKRLISEVDQLVKKCKVK